MLNEPCTLAFVRGSEEEQEKQKSEIREYCKRRLGIQSSDILFLSDWNMMLKKLKDKATIIFTNLRVFSTDYKELAKKLCDLIIDRRNFVCPIKEEHFNKLRNHQYDKRPEELLLIEGYRERALAGLEKLCCDILKDDDK